MDEINQFSDLPNRCRFLMALADSTYPDERVPSENLLWATASSVGSAARSMSWETHIPPDLVIGQ